MSVSKLHGVDTHHHSQSQTSQTLPIQKQLGRTGFGRKTCETNSSSSKNMDRQTSTGNVFSETQAHSSTHKTSTHGDIQSNKSRNPLYLTKNRIISTSSKCLLSTMNSKQFSTEKTLGKGPFSGLSCQNTTNRQATT